MEAFSRSLPDGGSIVPRRDCVHCISSDVESMHGTGPDAGDRALARITRTFGCADDGLTRVGSMASERVSLPGDTCTNQPDTEQEKQT